ncbi:MAG: hypothetical protein ABIG11_01045 [bacterium]
MQHFLLDTSVLVLKYHHRDEEEASLAAKIKRLFEAKRENDAFLFVPNFCIVETFNTFAKFCYEERLINEAAYNRYREALKADVVGGTILYSYELSRRHILAADEVLKPEHTSGKRGAGDSLSTVDILLISMGMDIARIVGRNNLKILANENRIVDVCKSSDKFPPAEHIKKFRYS